MLVGRRSGAERNRDAMSVGSSGRPWQTRGRGDEELSRSEVCRRRRCQPKPIDVRNFEVSRLGSYVNPSPGRPCKWGGLRRSRPQ